VRTEVKNGQWLGDVTLSTTGDISMLVEMARGNNMSVTERLNAGDVLLSAGVKNKDVAAYYSAKSLQPATASGREPDSLGGIGFMAVGITFVVS